MNFWRYKNATWEPYFKEIQPFLSKIYFFTSIGPVKRFVAKLIFKKLSWMEAQKWK